MGIRSQRSRRLLTGLLLSLVAGAGAAETCQVDIVELRGDWGQARFTAEVADDPSERARGLMHREEMSLSAGMLFVYEQPQFVSFWMRNTLISLDMIFMDAEGVVQHVHHNAVPLSEEAIPGGNHIQYVFEINGGLAQQLGITPGSEMRHPSIPADTAQWACSP